jgi:hypothetical protein
MKRNTGIDMKPFFKPEVVNTGLRGNREKKYSDAEIAEYYQRIAASSKKAGLRFSTCYIGNGAKDYYKYQNLWSNKQDCCDVRGNVCGFKTSAQDVSWSERRKHTPNKILADSSQESEKELDIQFNKGSGLKIDISPKTENSRTELYDSP